MSHTSASTGLHYTSAIKHPNRGFGSIASKAAVPVKVNNAHTKKKQHSL